LVHPGQPAALASIPDATPEVAVLKKLSASNVPLSHPSWQVWHEAVTQLIERNEDSKEIKKSFFALVNKTCDEGHLHNLLAAIRFAFQDPAPVGSFEKDFGAKDRKKLTTQLSKMRQVADYIESLPIPSLRGIPTLDGPLNDAPREILKRVVVACSKHPDLCKNEAIQQANRYFETKSKPYIALSNIPSCLRAIADRLEARTEHTRKRGRTMYNERVAALVNYVREKTGKPHRKEVADLIRAMREDDYSIETFKGWSRDNARLLRASKR
jgi:predicted nucleic acid binding AN1-type Zn finger protein